MGIGLIFVGLDIHLIRDGSQYGPFFGPTKEKGLGNAS